MEKPDNGWVYVFFGAVIVLVLVLGNVMGCDQRQHLNYDQPPEGSQYP